MNEIIQGVLTAAAVVWAVGYVVYRLWPRAGKSSCGACGSCPSNQASPVQLQTPISLETSSASTRNG